jgi:parallel beta-helix repeat protein
MKMEIIGSKANGNTIQGKNINLTGDDCLLIKSEFVNGKWEVPENITIKNFVIDKGSIRLVGLGLNGQGELVKESSRNKNHTEYCQASAPRNIIFENITVKANKRIPFYVGPGCTNITLRNSKLTGSSVATAIYLDCESARNTIENNIIETKVKREMLAIDGSAHNIIRGNVFVNPDLGGIYLYRNSGEGGTIRHQPPIKNVIEKNTFKYSLIGRAMSLIHPTIWVGARSRFMQYFYQYKDEDKGYKFGSSINNEDLASGNKIRNNKPCCIHVRNWGK